MKKSISALIILAIVALAFLLIRFVLGDPEDDWICEYGQWVKHGNPSSPMPTSVCGSALVDKVEKELNDSSVCYSPNGANMNFETAKQIAEEGCKDGELQENHFCNSSTGTWWIDFVPDASKEECNPACVVFVDTGETEINWRCTGLRDGGM